MTLSRCLVFKALYENREAKKYPDTFYVDYEFTINGGAPEVRLWVNSPDDNNFDLDYEQMGMKEFLAEEFDCEVEDIEIKILDLRVTRYKAYKG